MMKQLLSAVLTFIFLPLVYSKNNLENDDGEKYAGKSEVLILFIFFGMGLGGFLTHFLSRLSINVPYTVVIFLVGIIISLFVCNLDMGDMGHSARKWIDINPDLLLFLFLPVLIFGEVKLKLFLLFSFNINII